MDLERKQTHLEFKGRDWSFSSHTEVTALCVYFSMTEKSVQLSGDSGLCCCVPCLLSAINSLCRVRFHLRAVSNAAFMRRHTVQHSPPWNFFVSLSLCTRDISPSFWLFSCSSFGLLFFYNYFFYYRKKNALNHHLQTY